MVDVATFLNQVFDSFNIAFRDAKLQKLNDDNLDVAQLNGKLAKMISDLQSVQALLTQDCGSISDSDSD